MMMKSYGKDIGQVYTFARNQRNQNNPKIYY